jgi:hypothetical protein
MKTTATCISCGNQEEVQNMHKIDSPSKNYLYVCDYCNHKEHSYYDENPITAHKQASHGLSWSIELETSQRNLESNWLYQYKFLPTSDGSIAGTEWKSPIWRNLSGLQKLFRTIESKCQFDNECGTHLNIGTYNSEKINMLKRFYHSLFLPLCDHLWNNRAATIAIFGRDFTYYASTITTTTSPTRHENFINLQHSTHIEYRLCKFVTAEQYMTCIKMCTEFTKAINNNFIAHFNDHLTDNGITDITAYRKHKATITANKMIKIFDKYANKLNG